MGKPAIGISQGEIRPANIFIFFKTTCSLTKGLKPYQRRLKQAYALMDQFHNTPSKYINIFLKANCSLTKGLKQYQRKLKQAYALMDQFHNTPSKYINIFLNATVP
jgi:antitoxin component of RelBE/YafQ-DinJ toxin-antitoxin module